MFDFKFYPELNFAVDVFSSNLMQFPMYWWYVFIYDWAQWETKMKYAGKQ